eukprot:gene12938-5972_t
MVDTIASILEALPRIRTRVLDDTTIHRRTPILTASMDTSAIVDPLTSILEALPRIRIKFKYVLIITAIGATVVVNSSIK